jgi:COMM domain
MEARGGAIGALAGVEHRVGVAMSSSECGPLQQPFVSLSLRTRAAGGAEEQHAFEMTLAEFKDFADKFSAMKATMESLQ